MNILYKISWGLLLLMPMLATAQTEPKYEPTLNHSTAPTIERIESKDILERKKQHVSTPNEYYLKFRDTSDIEIIRERNNAAKIHIQGRGSVNSIDIFDENNIESDYPVISRTFRGVNYEEIDLSELQDGEYRVRFASPRTVTEHKLSIKSLVDN